MKLSRYNYIFTLSTGETAVFNTFSGAIALLNDEEKALFNTFPLNYSNDSAIDEFVKMGFIIDDTIDELNIIDCDRIKSTYCNTATFRILVTTLCNADCYYCYEKNNGNVLKTNMTISTAKAVVDFIISQISKDDVFRIEWFGGEPLLNGEIISYITNCLEKLGYNNGIYSLITNGTLVYKYDISCIKEEWKISRIQISFDGFEQLYNKIKKIKDIDNPFLQVCESIEKLAINGVKITIRMNLSDNFNDILKLIDFFKEKYLSYKNISYYIYPIFDGNESVSEQIVEEVIELNNSLIKNNLMNLSDVYLLNYKTSRCFATNYKGFTIDPEGNLYKCSHVMDPIDSIGNIYAYNPYNPSKLIFENVTLKSKCIKCVFLPICQGGCKAAELEKSQTSHCFLWKNKINSVLENIIKRREYYESD